MVPSFLIPVLTVMMNLCRKVDQINSSAREYSILTGRPDFLASTMATKSMGNLLVARLPNPPPTLLVITRDLAFRDTQGLGQLDPGDRGHLGTIIEGQFPAVLPDGHTVVRLRTDMGHPLGLQDGLQRHNRLPGRPPPRRRYYRSGLAAIFRSLPSWMMGAPSCMASSGSKTAGRGS